MSIPKVEQLLPWGGKLLFQVLNVLNLAKFVKQLGLIKIINIKISVELMESVVTVMSGSSGRRPLHWHAGPL